MKIHKLIKRLRIKQGLTQFAVSEGIMSRSSYTKFELGERSITTTEFEQILERLEAHITDLSDIENLENPIALEIRQLTKTSLTRKIDIKKLEEIYLALKNSRKKSIIDYRNYLYVKWQFKQYNKIIEPITKSEIEILFQKIKKKNYLTNYYIQLIMDFTPNFTTEQLIYFLKILEDYRVDWISPIECQYLHILPGAISNIIDSLLDRAVLNQSKPNLQLLTLANTGCKKLIEIIKLRPSFNYSLLLKLFQIKIEFYTATTKDIKLDSLEKAKKFRKELVFINGLQSYDNENIETTAAIALNSIDNFLNTGLPGEITYFFT